MLVPGMAVVAPSLLVRARSALGVSVSLSVSLSLVLLVSVTPAGGLTVAVLLSVPVAVGSTVPLTVSVMLWPLARLRPVQTPVAAVYTPVLGVKVGLRMVAGTLSTTFRLLTVLGPLLVTVIT